MLSEERVNSLIDEYFVLRNMGDIFGLFSIPAEVEYHISDGDNLMEESLRVIERLLDRGALVCETPYHTIKYSPWPNQQKNYVIDRIRTEWLALGRTPTIPDICWFGPKI